jgi:phosphoglucosamine mutase
MITPSPSNPSSRVGLRGENLGTVDAYADFLIKSAEGISLQGLSMAIDSAHGAASGLAGRVFRCLEADVITIADQPNGQNINENCGATHIGPLQKFVTSHGLDLGVALDGDADRLIMVTGKGREFTGDHIIYTLAAASQLSVQRKKRHNGVVVTQMTGLGAENALRGLGINVVRTDVGDRYVLQGLHETGYTLGGEQSGHIILPELLATGDGMLAAIQVIKAVRASGLTLDQWHARVPLLPQSLVNITVSEPGKALLQHPDTVAFVAKLTAILNGSGRVLVRASGTEPKVRIMVESPDAAEVAPRAAEGLQRLLAQLA